MPREIRGTLSHSPPYDSGITWTTKHAGDLSIGGYLSLWNSAYDFIDLGKEGVIHVAFSQRAASVESAKEFTSPFT